MVSEDNSSDSNEDDQKEEEFEETDEPTVGSFKPSAGPATTVEKKEKAKRVRLPAKYRQRKPADMPRRPLSAYNLYFRDERPHIVAEMQQAAATGGVQKGLFETLAKTIAHRWKELPENKRNHYKALALEESARYREAMELYNRKMVDEHVKGMQTKREQKRKKKQAAAAADGQDKKKKASRAKGPKSQPKLKSSIPSPPRASMSKPATALVPETEPAGSLLPGEGAAIAGGWKSQSDPQGFVQAGNMQAANPNLELALALQSQREAQLQTAQAGYGFQQQFGLRQPTSSSMVGNPYQSVDQLVMQQGGAAQGGLVSQYLQQQHQPQYQQFSQNSGEGSLPSSTLQQYMQYLQQQQLQQDPNQFTQGQIDDERISAVSQQALALISSQQQFQQPQGMPGYQEALGDQTSWQQNPNYGNPDQGGGDQQGYFR